MVDAARFPRLAQYLDQLPDGIASYRDCASKGVLFRSAIDGHDLSDVEDGLPPALRELIHNPPPAGVWVPAVLCDAAFHAVCDRYYPTQSAIMEWSDSRTQETSRHRVYRRVMAVAGPAVFLRLAEQVHNRMFQKGTVIKVKIDEASAEIRLSHPPHLHNPTKHTTNVPMLRRLLERVGGEDVVVEMRSSDAEGAIYRASWRG